MAGSPLDGVRRVVWKPPEREAERPVGFEPWDPTKHLEGPALRAFQDPAQYGAWCTTRRAGKTTAGLDWLLDPLIANDGLEAAYVGLTAVDAEKTVLRDLKQLCARHGFADPFKGYNRVRKILTLENGSSLEIRGLNDDGEKEKYRGRKYARVLIDECQSQSQQTLREMVDEAISPTLADFGGQLRLCGTPGRIARAGVYWYDVTHGGAGFSGHHWSIRDNRFIPNVDEFLAGQADRLGGVDSPAYRREYLGEWVASSDELVFPFKAERNEWHELPPGRWTFSIGFDLGHSPDRSALAVVGWREYDPTLYLVYEHVFEARERLHVLGEALSNAQAEYNPVGAFVDEGGLGAALAQELMERFPHLSLEPADKRAKLVQLEAMASDLLAGRLKFPAGSRASFDTGVVMWDVKKAAVGVREVAKLPHSDILDAVRYAIGGARHYLAENEPVALNEEERMLADMRAAAAVSQHDKDLGRFGFGG